MKHKPRRTVGAIALDHGPAIRLARGDVAVEDRAELEYRSG